MARRPRRSDPAPLPLFDGALFRPVPTVADHDARRRDAAAAIARLTAEREQLQQAQAEAPAAVTAAAAEVERIADQVVAIEDELAALMQREPGTFFAEQRGRLAVARGQLVDARSVLDRLVCTAAGYGRRIADIETDIAGWRRRMQQG